MRRTRHDGAAGRGRTAGREGDKEKPARYHRGRAAEIMGPEIAANVNYLRPSLFVVKSSLF